MASGGSIVDHVETGQVFGAWDTYGKRWITWLFLRACTDADVEHMDTWGYKAKGPDHEYWHILDLETGDVHITTDNVVFNDMWELL